MKLSVKQSSLQHNIAAQAWSPCPFLHIPMQEIKSLFGGEAHFMVSRFRNPTHFTTCFQNKELHSSAIFPLLGCHMCQVSSLPAGHDVAQLLTHPARAYGKRSGEDEPQYFQHVLRGAMGRGPGRLSGNFMGHFTQAEMETIRNSELERR